MIANNGKKNRWHKPIKPINGKIYLSLVNSGTNRVQYHDMTPHIDDYVLFQIECHHPLYKAELKGKQFTVIIISFARMLDDAEWLRKTLYHYLEWKGIEGLK